MRGAAGVYREKLLLCGRVVMVVGSMVSLEW